MARIHAAKRRPAVFSPFDPAGSRPDVVIAPSVLSSDFAHSSRELTKCRRAKARWIHVDIMDGHFVPNLTIGPPVLAKWSASEPDLFYDTHLMIEHPMKFAESFVEAGSHLLTIHVEATQRAKRDLRAIRRMGIKAGITLRPRTPVKSIFPLLEEVDLVLVMTVEPGFGGQALIPRTLNKVRELELIRSRDSLPFRLEVDGGINRETCVLAVAAGADVLVAGNAVFADGDVAGNLKGMRDALAANGCG